MRVRACAVLLALGLFLPTGAQAHSRWVSVFGNISSAEDPGQFQDQADVRVDLSNYNSFPVRVRCKVEATTTWYPDADNDGRWEFPAEHSRSVKWFATRIGRPGRYFASRNKTKIVHVRVPHPDKGPESYEWYGDDHFSGWEHSSMSASVDHCHGR